MIKSFSHKGLKELFETGKSGKVNPDLRKRCRERLLVLHAATKLQDLNLPGYDLHKLQPPRAGEHAIKVSGPWRITFEWKEGDVLGVDLEQYH